MEMSFADQANGGARDENVIPGLTALAEENEDFSGADNSQLMVDILCLLRLGQWEVFCGNCRTAITDRCWS